VSCCSDGGRVFQAAGAAYEKQRWPNLILSLILELLADRSRPRELTDYVGVTMSLRYDGFNIWTDRLAFSMSNKIYDTETYIEI